MELPNKIDPTIMPLWVTQPKYDGVESDIKNWYTSYYFWKRWNGKEDTIDTEMAKSRAIAEAKYEALKQTNAIKNSSERSAILQAYDIYKGGWYKYVGEIEDVRELLEEMLNDEIENKASGSKRYDLEFIIKQLFPALEAMNIPAEYIVAIPDNIAKARAMIPAARNILKTVEDPEEAKENIMELIKDIPNPEVSYRKYEDRIAEFMGKDRKPINMVNAEVFLIPDKELIVIESDRPHTIAIENNLKGIAQGFDFRDSITLMKKLNELLLPKQNDFYRYKISNGRLIQSGDGISLPSKEKFKELAINQTLNNRHTIAQLLDVNFAAEIAVHVIAQYVQDIDRENMKLFGTWDLVEIKYAISEFYSIPREIETIFDCCTSIGYGMLFPSNEIAITLTFCKDEV